MSNALRPVTRSRLRHRFDAITDPDYGGALDDEDFEYTWDNFVDVRDFYDRAAAAGRAVICTAAQRLRERPGGVVDQARSGYAAPPPASAGQEGWVNETGLPAARA